jgi:tripartite-type tricarboxylate transporter receptor subunit TctC
MKLFAAIFKVTAICAFSTFASAATAQQFPAKQVTFMTPFPSGSGPDTVLRIVAEKLSQRWGQQVIVENRPGGNGVIAIQAAKKASPDGYTLVQMDNMHLAAQPHLYKKLPYDPVKDFDPVATLFRAQFFVTVPSTSSWKNVSDLIDAAKAKPGALSYGSWFTGSPGHLGGALMETATGTRMIHVPFKETSQLYAAVGNNDVSWAFGSAATTGAMYRAGKVKYLAVASPKRAAGYEQVPTIAESGGPANFELTAWAGLLAPRGTPTPVVQKINQDIAKILSEPEIQQRFVTSFGYEVLLLPPTEIAALVKSDSTKFGEIIKRANITLD